MTAFSSRGIWCKSATQGIQQGYDNAWFAEHLIPLWTPEPSQSVTGEQLLLFPNGTLA